MPTPSVYPQHFRHVDTGEVSTVLSKISSACQSLPSFSLSAHIPSHTGMVVCCQLIPLLGIFNFRFFNFCLFNFCFSSLLRVNNSFRHVYRSQRRKPREIYSSFVVVYSIFVYSFYKNLRLSRDTQYYIILIICPTLASTTGMQDKFIFDFGGRGRARLLRRGVAHERMLKD